MASLTGALRLAAGPPFSVHRSSPDLANAPTQAAPAQLGDTSSRPALKQVTTFRTGMGEVVDTQVGPPRGKGKLIAAGLVVAALGGGAFMFLGGSEKDPPAAAAAAAPVASPTPPPPAPAPKAPAAKAKVTVRLASDPTGAKVVDASDGTALGVTPLSLTREQGVALKVRLEKDGYAPATRDVPLDENQALEFALEKKAAPRPKAPRKSREDGPAKL
jgi:hypothetical protein